MEEFKWNIIEEYLQKYPHHKEEILALENNPNAKEILKILEEDWKNKESTAVYVEKIKRKNDISEILENEEYYPKYDEKLFNLLEKWNWEEITKYLEKKWVTLDIKDERLEINYKWKIVGWAEIQDFLLPDENNVINLSNLETIETDHLWFEIFPQHQWKWFWKLLFKLYEKWVEEWLFRLFPDIDYTQKWDKAYFFLQNGFEPIEKYDPISKDWKNLSELEKNDLIEKIKENRYDPEKIDFVIKVQRIFY